MNILPLLVVLKVLKIKKNGSTQVKKFKIKNLKEFDDNLFLFNTEEDHQR